MYVSTKATLWWLAKILFQKILPALNVPLFYGRHISDHVKIKTWRKIQSCFCVNKVMKMGLLTFITTNSSSFLSWKWLTIRSLCRWLLDDILLAMSWSPLPLYSQENGWTVFTILHCWKLLTDDMRGPCLIEICSIIWRLRRDARVIFLYVLGADGQLLKWLKRYYYSDFETLWGTYCRWFFFPSHLLHNFFLQLGMMVDFLYWGIWELITVWDHHMFVLINAL
jgi:hypothetical protein